MLAGNLKLQAEGPLKKKLFFFVKKAINLFSSQLPSPISVCI